MVLSFALRRPGAAPNFFLCESSAGLQKGQELCFIPCVVSTHGFSPVSYLNSANQKRWNGNKSPQGKWHRVLRRKWCKVTLIIFFLITVYIQYYFTWLSGVRHGGSTIMYFTKCSPWYCQYPLGTVQSDYSRIGCISHVVLYIPVTTLYLLICTPPSLHLFDPAPQPPSALATISLKAH